jgi:hypothetical protein
VIDIKHVSVQIDKVFADLLVYLKERAYLCGAKRKNNTLNNE